MNTRKLLVTGLVLAGLVIALLISGQVAALRQPPTTIVSGSNQIFYSSSIESLVNSHRPIANQIFYSPSIESLIKSDSPIVNQVFYSPSIETFIQ
jgi:hypothetical protein